jgi:hypothetical protein
MNQPVDEIGYWPTKLDDYKPKVAEEIQESAQSP